MGVMIFSPLTVPAYVEANRHAGMQGYRFQNQAAGLFHWV